MSKMSNNRKFLKGKSKVEPIPRRDLDAEELREFLRMTDLVNCEQWKAIVIAGNTALFNPKGKEFAERQAQVASVLTEAKDNWISQTLTKCGVTPGVRCAIDPQSGKITEDVKDPNEKLNKKKS